MATGLATSCLSAALLLAAHAKTDDAASAAWFIPSFALVFGAFASLFHARRLRALLVGLVLGLVSGVASSVGLLRQPVEGIFFAVAATMTFFAALGLVVGAFVEFVMFLHHVSHGRRPGRYGGPDKA